MYKKYKADDFLNAPGFVNWVRQQDRKSEKFWDSWVENNPDSWPEIKKARAMVIAASAIEKLPSDKQIKSLWKRIDGKIIGLDKRKPFRLNPTIYKWAVAAAVGGLIVVMALYGWDKIHVDEKELYSTRMMTKSCSAGEKSTITLMDGTRIILNSSSLITFPEVFSSDSRVIELEGEAFFDVARDPSRPFIINSGNLRIKVLGTSFNVTTYPSSNEVKVAVATGKVAIDSYDEKGDVNQITLAPNEMAIYSRSSNELTMTSYDSLEVLAWKDGILYFKNKNINQITAELAKWYGVTFVIDKKLNHDYDYTGAFDNESLEEVLIGLGFVFDFDFKIQDKVVTIN